LAWNLWEDIHPKLLFLTIILQNLWQLQFMILPLLILWLPILKYLVTFSIKPIIKNYIYNFINNKIYIKIFIKICIFIVLSSLSIRELRIWRVMWCSKFMKVVWQSFKLQELKPPTKNQHKKKLKRLKCSS
jgi:hypothetical protein